MSRYCSVCGRELTRSIGPIGPKCLQKIRGKTSRGGIRPSKAQYIKMAAKHDMYGGADGQKEDEAASESPEG